MWSLKKFDFVIALNERLRDQHNYQSSSLRRHEWVYQIMLQSNHQLLRHFTIKQVTVFCWLYYLYKHLHLSFLHTNSFSGPETSLKDCLNKLLKMWISSWGKIWCHPHVIYPFFPPTTNVASNKREKLRSPIYWQSAGTGWNLLSHFTVLVCSLYKAFQQTYKT